MPLVKSAIRSVNSADANHQVVLPRILFNMIVPFDCTKAVAATWQVISAARLLPFSAFGGHSFFEFIKS